MHDPVLERLTRALGTTHSIEQELTGGGMARVFVATEVALGRRVVVKTLPADEWSTSAQRRFQREILTAARLQHANIVPLLGAGEADGVPYFTMPLVEGETLRARLDRGPIPRAEAIGILRDVARALGAAHAKGIVHRDIKPENILLSAGAALVSDFGVAKALSLATRPGAGDSHATALGVAVGTPAYMAPEQVAGEAGLDHRADLYAWGVVAYEVLSGRRPFDGLSGAALLAAQVATVPPALSARARDVSASLADLVMQCLAKDAASRPPSAEALLAVLDAPADHRPQSRAVVAGRWPVVATLGLVALLVGAWSLRRRVADPGDARVVAVAPFRIGGASPETHYLREGLGDMLVPQLQTIPGRGAATMRTMLDRWQRAAGSLDRDLDDDRARAVALDAGAGELILGEIVGTRDRLTVQARLLRASDGRTLGTAQVSGTADSVAGISTRLLAILLSVSDDARQERMRAVLSARTSALLPYLLGEQALRRGRYDDAGRSFATAYAEDTTFAVAALRVVLANTWTVPSGVPGPWIGRAWAHRARLTGSDSLLLLARAGAEYPTPPTGPAHLERMEAMARQGDVAELWYTFGDELLHLGPSFDEPDVARRSLEAFRRAEALDSSFAPALEHQPELLYETGDLAAAWEALARQRRRIPDSEYLRFSALNLYLAQRDSVSALRLLDTLARSRPGALWFAAYASALEAPGMVPLWSVADSALVFGRRATTGRDDRQLLARIARENGWNSGRRRMALEAPADADDVPGLFEEVMSALFADADSARAERAVRRLAERAGARDLADTSAATALARFGVAMWGLAKGDSGIATRMAEALAATRAPADAPWRASSAHLLGELLHAVPAVAHGATDAGARLTRLDSLMLHQPGLERRRVRCTANLVLAALFEQAGDLARARRAALRRDNAFGDNLFHVHRLRLQARLARSLGLADEERRVLEGFVALRERADPTLQPEVAAARERLAALVGS